MASSNASQLSHDDVTALVGDNSPPSLVFYEDETPESGQLGTEPTMGDGPDDGKTEPDYGNFLSFLDLLENNPAELNLRLDGNFIHGRAPGMETPQERRNRITRDLSVDLNKFSDKCLLIHVSDLAIDLGRPDGVFQDRYHFQQSPEQGRQRLLDDAGKLRAEHKEMRFAAASGEAPVSLEWDEFGMPK